MTSSLGSDWLRSHTDWMAQKFRLTHKSDSGEKMGQAPVAPVPGEDGLHGEGQTESGDLENAVTVVEDDSAAKYGVEGEEAVRCDSIGPSSSPANRRQIGVVSATFLVFNRIVGTGIFATPSAILALSGSVGVALLVWVFGMIIAVAGTAVFLEFGTAIPRNGGEKNYLEYVYTKPKFLATAVFASYAFLLAGGAGNSVVFGEYVLHACNVEVNRWNQRGIGFACITVATFLHMTAVNWGLRVQNVLGLVKLIIIVLIILCGLPVLLMGDTTTLATDNFKHPFSGSGTSAYGIVTALYLVIFSFIGYSNANYALSETRNPVRTLSISAPLAVISVGVLYILTNVAYFAVVPRDVMLGSGRILAASFFRIVISPKAERVISMFVALSAFGNVQSVLFAQGRIIQALGREGILPFSRFWASNRPFNSPSAGLLQHYLICVFVMLVPPPGDAYNFLLNVVAYPSSVVNLLVSVGLIHIYLFPRYYPSWYAPIRASLPVTVFFCVSNVYLSVAPFLPPTKKSENVYKDLPYYVHCLAGLGVFFVGAFYWLLWARLIPWLRGYRLSQEGVIGQDGWSRTVIKKIPVKAPSVDDDISVGDKGDSYAHWVMEGMRKWWPSRG